MKIGGSNVMWIGHPLFGEEKAIILLDSFFFLAMPAVCGQGSNSHHNSDNTGSLNL